jgi:hypothetical protein
VGISSSKNVPSSLVRALPGVTGKLAKFSHVKIACCASVDSLDVIYAISSKGEHPGRSWQSGCKSRQTRRNYSIHTGQFEAKAVYFTRITANGQLFSSSK